MIEENLNSSDEMIIAWFAGGGVLKIQQCLTFIPVKKQCVQKDSYSLYTTIAVYTVDLHIIPFSTLCSHPFIDLYIRENLPNDITFCKYLKL